MNHNKSQLILKFTKIYMSDRKDIKQVHIMYTEDRDLYNIVFVLDGSISVFHRIKRTIPYKFRETVSKVFNLRCSNVRITETYIGNTSKQILD